MKRYYSVREAEELIPSLKPKILKLIKLSNAIELLDAIDIEYNDEYETIKKDIRMNKKFHEYSLQFCKEVENLLESGIVLKDLNDGVVNFFSMHGTKEIFLCWSIGENNINTWYSANENFESRKPVSDLKKKNV